MLLFQGLFLSLSSSHFWFHVVNDYKVIRQVRFFTESSGEYPSDLEDIISSDWLGDISLAPLWEVYSLRSYSWRELDVNMPSSLDYAEGTHPSLLGWSVSLVV